MRLQTVVSVLLLVTLAFAGCSDKKGGGGEGDGTGTKTGTSTKTGSASGTSTGSGTSGPGGANRAPTASLSASVANGTIPLNVTFSVSGSDPDGDNLTWDLAFGDGSAPAQGSGVPGQSNHTFTAAGNYTAVLTVSDGALEATSNVTVSVAAGGGSANSFIVTLADICNSDELKPCARSPNGCPDFRARTPGTFCAWFPIPAELKGKEFTLTSTGGDPDAIFTASPNGGPCAFPANEVSRTSFAAEGPEEGTIPTTSATGDFAIDCLTLVEYVAAPSTLTFTWAP
jgi:PKD repeat protein